MSDSDALLPFAPDAATLFGEWRNYLRDLKRVSSHTLTVYERNVIDYVGTLSRGRGRAATTEDVISATVQDGRAWLSSMQKRGVAGRSSNVGLSAVRNFYRFLQKRGYGENEAAFSLRFARKEKLLPKPAAHTDVTALLRSWKEIYPDDPPDVVARDVSLFVLLYGTGMRISEALALNAGNIGAETRGVTIVGKGNKERLIPVTAYVAAHVEAYKELRGAVPDEPLFIGTQGKRLHPDMARRRLRTARRAMGLGEHISPHSLRHGFATDLLEKDGDLRVIQELLGHAYLSSTEIYAKLSDARMNREYMAAHPRAKKRKETE
ncbi:MAG: tyrosine-type recombinase/integrase [Rickettsiales bacterium]